MRHDLNININGLPSKGFSGDSSLIARVEARVGHRLPDAYIDLLHTANGGHPEVGSFFLSAVTDHSVGIDWFYSLGDTGTNSVDKALNDWADLLGPSMLPFARDGGGNQFYIALASGDESVWYFSHDEKIRTRLADCFEVFISQLRVNPDFI